MRRSDIRLSLEKIQATDATKSKIYNNILEKSRDEKYVSKQKLHFVKLRIDRIVPYAAAFVILFCCFAVYGVNSGLFTGTPREKAVSSGAAAVNENATKGEGAIVKSDEPVAEISQSNAQATKAAKGAGANLNAAPVTVVATLPFDVGFTSYTIENVPQDAFALWDELVRLKAVPEFVLESFSLDGTTLTLNFDQSLQKRLSAAATATVATGIAKTFAALYPNSTALVINSDGAPIEFSGEKIDCNSLIAENVSVTDSKTIEYGASQ